MDNVPFFHNKSIKTTLFETRTFECILLFLFIFRLGRYPIHFHMNGDMSQSYVKSSSVHKAFNRAINIHNSHNILLKNNVIYDIMGGALFLEDGIETGKNKHCRLMAPFG